jgi:hypothetical protein
MTRLHCLQTVQQKVHTEADAAEMGKVNTGRLAARAARWFAFKPKISICFQTKNLNLGKIWRSLGWKMLLYFVTI